MPSISSPSRSAGWQVDLRAHVEAVDRLGASGESLQGRLEPKVVERRRAQLGDQVAQAVDLVAETLENVRDDVLERLGIVNVARVGQSQAQRADALDAFVVDLPRPAGALALAGLHPEAQPFDLHGALGREPLREARGERARAPHGRRA